MNGVSLSDRERLSMAVHGHRVPRDSWASLSATHELVDQANALWSGLQAEVEEIRRKAHAEGLEQGRAAAVAQMAAHLTEAQQGSRELLDAQDSRVIDLAAALVRRILPQLDTAAIVDRLLADALRTMKAERHLQVSVHPQMREHVRARLDAWRGDQASPLSLLLVEDAQLDLLGVIVESEQGSVRAGFEDQLRTLTGALHRSVDDHRP